MQASIRETIYLPTARETTPELFIIPRVTGVASASGAEISSNGTVYVDVNPVVSAALRLT